MTTREEIIKLLGTMPQKAIAERFGVSEAYVSKVKKQVKKVVKKEVNLTKLTTSKRRWVNANNISSLSSPSSSQPVRIHALGILQHYQQPASPLSIENRLEESGYRYCKDKYEAARRTEAGERVYWESQENNTIYFFLGYKGFIARLTTQSLTAWAHEIDAPKSEPALKEAEEALRTALRQARQELAAMLKLTLADDEEVVEEHIAFVDDYFARKWPREEGALSVPDPQDGKERRRIDYSKGPPEYEFTHRKYSRDDALLYDRHVEQITVQKIWSIDQQLAFNQSISELNQAQQSLNQSFMDEQFKFFAKHNRLMDEIRHGLAKQRKFTDALIAELEKRQPNEKLELPSGHEYIDIIIPAACPRCGHKPNEHGFSKCLHRGCRCNKTRFD
jgi:transposase